jgi:hypothetical protein
MMFLSPVTVDVNGSNDLDFLSIGFQSIQLLIHFDFLVLDRKNFLHFFLNQHLLFNSDI